MNLLTTLAISETDSLFPIPISSGPKKSACPPNRKKPVSTYAKNKLKAEKLCESYSNKYKLDVLIFRIPSLFGVGLKKQLIYDACKKLSKNNNIFFGSGKELRDWIHIDDISRLIFMIIIKKFKKLNYFNCSSKNKFTTNRIISYSA